MKVLWFEVTVPSKYRNDGNVVAGWQDSLESIVSRGNDIELYIAFEVNTPSDVKVIEGVTYIPIYVNYNWLDRKLIDFSWRYIIKKLVPSCLSIVNHYKPDLIHIFGNEWPFGLIAKSTSIPIVIHVQGSIIPYHNALYPPNYNVFTFIKFAGLNFLKQYRLLKFYYKELSRLKMESEIWKLVSNYMGRTVWDLALVNTLHPYSNYWHVDEALRPSFLTSSKKWSYKRKERVILFTTGISSLWKGPDMLLKTASILKNMGLNFEWRVAGRLDEELRQVIEKKENKKFAHNNVRVLGFLSPEELIENLCESSLYVHTAYIENSPNSICEAQVLGVPVVSTNVGGIESLVHNNIDGVLVPANDPWRMAYTIKTIVNDEAKLRSFSFNSFNNSTQRHNIGSIYKQLLDCYNSLR